MKTEQEIRDRIRAHQLSVEEEEANGGLGGEDWTLAVTAISELQWVLGE